MITKKLKNEKPHVDAICLGELLIDFVALQEEKGLAAAPRFLKAAGGAPANVAVGLARLGVQTAFISKVGKDEFGYFLRETLRENRDEELAFLVRDGGRPESLQKLWRPHHQLLVVTLGPSGCYYMTSHSKGFASRFPVSPIDTTGAGDAFVAGLLAGVIECLSVQPVVRLSRK